MSSVNLMIHGRPYNIACDEEQVHRVNELGQFIDQKVREIMQAGAASNENHALVIASLMIADQMYDYRDQADSAAAAPQPSMDEEEKDMLLKAIDHMTNKVAGMTQRIQQA